MKQGPRRTAVVWSFVRQQCCVVRTRVGLVGQKRGGSFAHVGEKVVDRQKNLEWVGKEEDAGVYGHEVRGVAGDWRRWNCQAVSRKIPKQARAPMRAINHPLRTTVRLLASWCIDHLSHRETQTVQTPRSDFY